MTSVYRRACLTRPRSEKASWTARWALLRTWMRLDRPLSIRAATRWAADLPTSCRSHSRSDRGLAASAWRSCSGESASCKGSSWWLWTDRRWRSSLEASTCRRTPFRAPSWSQTSPIRSNTSIWWVIRRLRPTFQLLRCRWGHIPSKSCCCISVSVIPSLVGFVSKKHLRFYFELGANTRYLRQRFKTL